MLGLIIGLGIIVAHIALVVRIVFKMQTEFVDHGYLCRVLLGLVVLGFLTSLFTFAPDGTSLSYALFAVSTVFWSLIEIFCKHK